MSVDVDPEEERIYDIANSVIRDYAVEYSEYEAEINELNQRIEEYEAEINELNQRIEGQSIISEAIALAVSQNPTLLRLMILAIEKSLTETTEQDTTNELKAFLETLDPTKRKVDEEKLLQIEGKLYKSGREIKESLDAGEIQTKQIAGLVNRLKAQIIKYAN